MRLRAILSIGCVLAGCSAPEPDALSSGTWVGTITTEGDVTTVVNESGSVWGGTARLVEEVSIGVDAGAEEYMFGYIHGLYATDREIYVLDSQVAVVRVYDFAGNHLRNIGGRGQGPGEFEYPAWLLGTPDGRIFVQGDGRVNVFTSAGDVLDSIPLGATHCCVHPTIVTEEGVPFVPVRTGNPFAETTIIGLQEFGAEGAVGPIIEPPGSGYEPIRVAVGERARSVRFAPHHTWAAAPWGAIVGGVSDEYRFEIRDFDGDTVLVEKSYEPVPVQTGERDWWRRYAVASARMEAPEWTWDGAEMPDVKPAFSSLIPTYSQQIWVTRETPAQKVDDCLEDITVENVSQAVNGQCWSVRSRIDVFGADGRFLGELERPEGKPWFSAQGVFARDRTVLLWVIDEAGVYTVKRYRLVLPGDREPQ